MPSNSRRRARIAAMNALYALEIGKLDPEAAAEDAIAEANLTDSAKEFANRLFRSALERGDEIRAALEERSHSYSLDRMAAIDRCVLQLAVAEILRGEEPPAVVINEAVEIAREYSTEDSGKFVNGILGAFVEKASNSG